MKYKTLALTVILVSSLATASQLFATHDSPTPDGQPRGKHSIFWKPLLSFFLPGTDQWVYGDYAAASAYTGLAIGSLAWSSQLGSEIEDFEESDAFLGLTDEGQDNIKLERSMYRNQVLSSQVFLAAASMSAYESFLHSIDSYRDSGEFDFIENRDTRTEVLTAAFDFSFIKNKTTWIPLSVITGLALLDSVTEQEDFEKSPLTLGDFGYTAAYSYNAGTFEEALFRGWIMPALMYKTGSPFWSNFTQAGIFAAAHLNQVSRPYVQFGLGMYLGWLTQKNGWSFREAIFIHSWWDVGAFLIQFQNRKKDPLNYAPAVLWLPKLSLKF